MTRVPNPIRLLILWVGLALSRVGLIDRQRVRRITALAWPRIVTGIARMSKNAVDVAMVGVAVGAGAIAGVGFAGAYWGLAFAVGGGIAGGTIALVSQSYGARDYRNLGQAVRSSALLVVALTVPITVTFWLYSTELIGLISNNPEVIDLGGQYLQVVSLGIPFAALNLIGSRTLVGADDAYTAMLVRTSGAIANITINTVLIFGFELGVVGAALGTVFSNVVVTAMFGVGLAVGRVPGIGEFPVTVSFTAVYADGDMIRQLLSIGLPVMGRELVWVVAEFPLLSIVDLFGQNVAAGYVITRRIWGIMNTPGWGFGLASSSLVGQELGDNDEGMAEVYGREIVRFAVVVYVASATLVFAFAEPIVIAFVGDPTDPSVPIAISLVYAACVAVVLQGVSKGAAGPLDASGDTRWPFYSQAVAMFGFSIPVAYLGAVTPLGLWGLYLAFVAETAVPATINYYRFATGKWKIISRSYGPRTTTCDD